MATRTFCDSCGTELLGENIALPGTPLENGKGGVVVLIHAGYNELGKGDVCAYCVLDAVSRMDDRPRQAK